MRDVHCICPPSSSYDKHLSWLEPGTSRLIGFNVSQLLKSPTGTIRRVEVNELDPELAADPGIVSPTRGTLRLMRTAEGILVTGMLTHELSCDCGRCLEPFTRTQQLQIEEEFLPIVDVNTGVPVREPSETEAFTLAPDHVLDLTQAIRELAILESPLLLLCKEECQGLCPDCGVNLNVEQCGHEREGQEAAPGSFGALLAERLREAGFKPEQE
jgi:uncharacterized protein